MKLDMSKLDTKVTENMSKLNTKMTENMKFIGVASVTIAVSWTKIGQGFFGSEKRHGVKDK